MSPGAQNMKMGVDAHGTAENEAGRAKNLKRDPTPSLLPKMSLGEQNMITRPDALGTAENKFGRAKQENGTRRPRYIRK
jgi:hypothetical protein